MNQNSKKNLTHKLVLTGGPCAGKTSIAAVLAHAFDGNVALVPEAATVLFRGGFPRWPGAHSGEALQRAIYHTQKSLEDTFAHHFADKLLILDRGSLDGAAYWPNGVDAFFNEFKTNLLNELNNYSCVIYLASAGQSDYEQNTARNPIRTETWEEAKKLDTETRRLWKNHPHFHFIENQNSFSDKIFSVLKIVEAELST